MIAFFNHFTGTTFLVADDRVDEYKAAGFAPVADLEKPKKVEVKKVEEVPEEPKKEEPKKTVRRMTKKK